ncbi:MAG: vitamin B12 dependent-methionine synthase activation domain-containing protein [bacterium]
MPEQESVLQNQGISEGATINERIHSLLNKAMNMFIESVRPEGMIKELSIKDFETIFEGEGENAIDTPLEHIFPQAQNLALFAITLGSKVSLRIEDLFRDNDFAVGSMLDAVASLAADKAVEVFEAYFFNNLAKRQLTTKDSCVLSYSPGYCGWHISGQRKLFHHLKPDRIGISLNDSFLMTPLKSVTGVLVSGKKKIHHFESNYPFCRFCKTYSCRQRMKRLSIA